MSLITGLLPLALRLIGMFLDKKIKDEKAKEAYLELVSRLQTLQVVSTNLYKEDIAQRDQLRLAHAELHKPKAE